MKDRNARRGGLAACLLAPLLATAAAPARAEPVALELVLAVDASSSVDFAEFDLQARGLAAAFRDPAVHDALRSIGEPGIAVTVLQWAGARRQKLAVPWRRLGDAADAVALAEALAAMPRYVVRGGTAIGDALKVATEVIETNGFEGRRRVIDVSGDGRSNMGRPPGYLRAEAVARGITINGLAILNEEAGVDRYYLDNVIGGDGAFLMTAANYQDFAQAIRRKLVREISGSPMVQRQDPRLAAGPAPAGGPGGAP